MNDQVICLWCYYVRGVHQACSPRSSISIWCTAMLRLGHYNISEEEWSPRLEHSIYKVFWISADIKLRYEVEKRGKSNWWNAEVDLVSGKLKSESKGTCGKLCKPTENWQAVILQGQLFLHKWAACSALVGEATRAMGAAVNHTLAENETIERTSKVCSTALFNVN